MATLSIVRQPRHRVRRESIPLVAQRGYRSNYAGTNDSRRDRIAADWTGAGIRRFLYHINNFGAHQVDFAPSASTRNWHGDSQALQGLDAVIKMVDGYPLLNGSGTNFDSGRHKSDLDFMRVYDALASVGLVLYDFPASMNDNGGTVFPSRECWGSNANAALRGMSRGMADLFIEVWNRYDDGGPPRITIASFGQETKGVGSGTRNTKYGDANGAALNYGPAALNNWRDRCDGFTYFAKRIRSVLGDVAHGGPELWAFHLDAFAYGSTTTDVDNLLAGGNVLGGDADRMFTEALNRFGHDQTQVAVGDYATLGPWDPSLLPDKITVDISIASSGRFRSGVATTDYDTRRSRAAICQAVMRVIDGMQTAAWSSHAIAAGLPANGYNVPVFVVEQYEEWDLQNDSLNADPAGQGALLGDMIMANIDSPFCGGDSRWEGQGDSDSGDRNSTTGKPRQCLYTPYTGAGAALANPNLNYFQAWDWESLLDTTFPVGTQMWTVTPDATDSDVTCIAGSDVAVVHNRSRTASKTVTILVDGVPLIPIAVAPRDFTVVSLPVPGPTYYAKDDFSRSVAGGWGSADVGGPYAISGGATTDYNVDGVEGTIACTNGGSRNARLTSVSAQDVTGTFRAKIDKLPVGGNVQPQVWVRRSSDGLNDYRVKLMIAAAGALTLGVSRRSNGSAETTVAAFVTPAAKAAVAAGEFVRVRFRIANDVSGTATIQVRAWGDTDPEPSTWDINTTNAQADNQIAGHSQLFVFTSSGVTNATTAAPITTSFASFALTPAFEFQRSDAGTGTDASSAVIVNITNVTGSDSSTGADASTAVVAIAAAADAGAAAEASTPTATFTSTDAAASLDASTARTNQQTEAGSGADASSAAAAIAGTEAGAGADASSASATVAAAEAGLSADQTEQLTTAGTILTSDEGEALDASTARAAELLEAGAGVEDPASLTTSLTTSEAAAGADAVSFLAAASTTADSALAGDLAALAAALAVNDTGVMDDGSSRDIGQAFALEDFGIGIDVAAPARGYGVLVPAVIATARLSVDVAKRGTLTVTISRSH